ncbi:MAG: PAS domain S-box protein [Candidatus Limnocylindrales bacterium]|nr:PAS domain S-box protein [Candidatus Limnocylindrales bacterium]
MDVTTRSFRSGPAQAPPENSERPPLAVENAELGQYCLFREICLFRGIVTSVAEVIFVTDAVAVGDRSLLYVNPAYEKVWGRTSESLHERPCSWMDAVVPEDRGRIIAAREGMYAGGFFDEEFCIEKPDGATRCIHARGFPIESPRGAISRVALIAEDVTDRKAAEDRRRKIDRRWRDMVEAAREGIVVADPDWRLTFVNAGMANMLGYTPDEVVGHHMVDFLEEEGQAILRDRMGRRVDGGAEQDDLKLRSRDGRVVWTIINSTPFNDPDGRFGGVLATITNVTKRKRAEEALQQAHDDLERRIEERTAELRMNNEALRVMTSRLSLAEEQERRRIASDLHDTILQTLALCKIKLGELGVNVSSGGDGRLLEEVRGLADQLICDMRDIVSELSPPLLYELGFEPAIERLLERLEEQRGIATQFQDDGLPKQLEDHVRVILFQAVRELLVNVAKHANARQVLLRVSRDKRSIWIVLEDDGVGFDTSRVGFHQPGLSGFGLINIRERLHVYGGTLDVRSTVGCGTRITLTTPLMSGGG